MVLVAAYLVSTLNFVTVRTLKISSFFSGFNPFPKGENPPYGGFDFGTQ